MHCTTSGGLGSLLPNPVLSSPRSHRSEYYPPCPPPPPPARTLLHLPAGLLLSFFLGGLGGAALSDVHVHLGLGQD